MPVDYMIRLGVTLPLAPTAAALSMLFRPACDVHDFAYSTYASFAEFSARRAAADAQFLIDMLAICNAVVPVGPLRTTCAGFATLFYSAVVVAGEDNYRKAQMKAGICTDCEVPRLAGDIPPRPFVLDGLALGSADRLTRNLPRLESGDLDVFDRVPASAFSVDRPVAGRFYVTTSPFVVVDGIQIDGVKLEEGPSAHVEYQVQALPGTRYVDFALAAVARGDGDVLSAQFNGAEIWSAPLRDFDLDVAYVAHLPRSSMAPGGQLRFSIRGTGARDSAVLLGDLGDVVYGFGEPQAPRNLRAVVTTPSVAVEWQASTPTATHYVVEAAAYPRGPAIARLAVGAVTSLSTGAPPGRYWVRVIGVNAIGEGEPSSEIEVVVPPPSVAPPVLASPTVNGSTVTLAWTGSPGATYRLWARASLNGPVLYVADVGSQPQLAVPGVPAGTYYVSIVAQAPGAVSVESNRAEVVVR